jgi:hypothetical protein
MSAAANAGASLTPALHEEVKKKIRTAGKRQLASDALNQLTVSDVALFAVGESPRTGG